MKLSKKAKSKSLFIQLPEVSHPNLKSLLQNLAFLQKIIINHQKILFNNLFIMLNAFNVMKKNIKLLVLDQTLLQL